MKIRKSNCLKCLEKVSEQDIDVIQQQINLHLIIGLVKNGKKNLE